MKTVEKIKLFGRESAEIHKLFDALKSEDNQI